MIISHKHKFIFFAVPKTATRTIRQALTAHTGVDDWEQQVLFQAKAIPIPEVAAISHGHISVTQIRAHLSHEIWHSYFKFGFVRNPYDRYVSTCLFLHRNTPDFAASAVPFMKQAIRQPGFRQRILALPQTELLTDGSGKIALDYVGRFETLQRSYDEICGHIGIPTTALSNTPKHDKFGQYYDQELKTLVSGFYRPDFLEFDYSYDSVSLSATR